VVKDDPVDARKCHGVSPRCAMVWKNRTGASIHEKAPVCPQPIGIGKFPAERPKRLGCGSHESRVVRRQSAVRQEEIVLKSHAHMAAEQSRRRYTSRFLLAEGTDHEMGKARHAGCEEGQEILRYGALA